MTAKTCTTNRHRHTPLGLQPLATTAVTGWRQMSHQMVLGQQLRRCKDVSVPVAQTFSGKAPIEQQAADIGEVNIRSECQKQGSL